MQQNREKGFTLIELMIAVAIIGILAGIAYPNYQEHVRKSRRADAKAALASFANAMERQYTQDNDYCDLGGTGGASTCGTATNDTGAPTIFSTTAPVDGTDTYYNLTISAATTNTYTLSATPVNAQAGDKCGTLTLNNMGVKSITGQNAGVVSANCW